MQCLETMVISRANEDVPESKRLHFGGFQARMTAEYLKKLPARGDTAGRGFFAQKRISSIESDAGRQAVDDTMNFCCTKQAHSSIPPLMADDVHLNVAPSLKVRLCEQCSSLAKSI